MQASQTFQDLALRLKDALDCDRSTVFGVDRARSEVFSLAASSLEIAEIRLPINRGVVGYVARTGRTLNLRDVYNDPRFDRSVDRKTGYRSKTMLTMAVRDGEGAVVGVLQALNKREGVFIAEDEATMATYCAEALSAMRQPA